MSPERPDWSVSRSRTIQKREFLDLQAPGKSLEWRAQYYDLPTDCGGRTTHKEALRQGFECKEFTGQVTPWSTRRGWKWDREGQEAVSFCWGQLGSILLGTHGRQCSTCFRVAHGVGEEVLVLPSHWSLVEASPGDVIVLMPPTWSTHWLSLLGQPETALEKTHRYLQKLWTQCTRNGEGYTRSVHCGFLYRLKRGKNVPGEEDEFLSPEHFWFSTATNKWAFWSMHCSLVSLAGVMQERWPLLGSTWQNTTS